MGNVGATEFKARCLELMDRVAEGRETYVITKRGKPVAKLVPADPPRENSVFGCMADRMEVVGNIEKPLRTDQEWRDLERERAEQWGSWERERRGHQAGSGKARRRPRR
jgi:prevent-host-death family protein